MADRNDDKIGSKAPSSREKEKANCPREQRPPSSFVLQQNNLRAQCQSRGLDVWILAGKIPAGLPKAESSPEKGLALINKRIRSFTYWNQKEIRTCLTALRWALNGWMP